MADITIPPEAVEAAVEAIRPLRHNPFITDSQLTRAALRAALAEWPGMAAIKEADGTTVAAVYLPLPQEVRETDWGKPQGKEEW